MRQCEQQPKQTEWPYFWSSEYLIDVTTNCVCDGSGFLPLPDQTMIATVMESIPIASDVSGRWFWLDTEKSES